MGPPWSGQGPSPAGLASLQEDRDAQDSTLTAEAEAGALWPQAERRQGWLAPPAAGWGPEQTPSKHPGGAGPVGTLILGFQPPGP